MWNCNAFTPVLELRGGGLALLVQALPHTPIIGLRSVLAIRPPENFLIIRPLIYAKDFDRQILW